MVFSFDVLVVVGCLIWSSTACPGCCPGLICSGNCFTFGEPPSRSAKLIISDGAALSSGDKVIHHFPLMVVVVVPDAGDNS